MHLTDLRPFEHGHTFGTDRPRAGERRTRWVVALTLVMMTVEIAAGSLYGSMALLADGWHMGTHAAALGIALFAHVYARRHAADRRHILARHPDLVHVTVEVRECVTRSSCHGAPRRLMAPSSCVRIRRRHVAEPIEPVARLPAVVRHGEDMDDLVDKA